MQNHFSFKDVPRGTGCRVQLSDKLFYWNRGKLKMSECFVCCGEGVIELVLDPEDATRYGRATIKDGSPDCFCFDCGGTGIVSFLRNIVQRVVVNWKIAKFYFMVIKCL